MQGFCAEKAKTACKSFERQALPLRRKKEATAIDTTERCAYKCAALRQRRLADKNLRKRRLKTLFMQILLPTKLLKGVIWQNSD